ncbi:MAG: DNA alkylation repair protein [Thermoplasmatota archaeon]
MELSKIMEILKYGGSPENIAGQARFGIRPKKSYGTPMPAIRDLAKKIGRDHDLALRLWRTGYRETMITAVLIDDPGKVTSRQMEEWALDFYDWEICDQTVMNLFHRTGNAAEKTLEWCGRDEEFVKRAGFVMIARMALKDSKLGDSYFEALYPVIFEGSKDERHNVKKGVSWALRQIGKRNLNLNDFAVKTAEKIGKIDSPSPRWISSDVLRELTDDRVITRISRK